MKLSFEQSAKRVENASRFVPGGVSSNFRLGVSPHPLVFDRGEGACLFDIDGNRLIDYYLGMGPMILGHNPPAIIEAVREQVGRGIIFGGQAEIEYQAAELICETLPSAERVRFNSSGTEAIQAALRVSRAATGRDTIIKFEGHYHGWLDSTLWSVAPDSSKFGPPEAPVAIPMTDGQDRNTGLKLEIHSWNRADWITERLSRGDVAAVIMEPVLCNTGGMLPKPGYLEAVREACSRHGTVLIFDEVIVGYRVGLNGAQGRLGVTPDITIFGKAVANGFQVAGLAGRADLFDLFGSGKVMHGGTYNAQCVSMAATVATIEELKKPGVFENMEAGGRKLMDGISRINEAHGLTATVTGMPQAFHVGWGLEAAPENYRDILGIDRAGYVRLTTRLLQNGVRALERGTWFMSTAHDDAILDETLEAYARAIAAE